MPSPRKRKTASLVAKAAELAVAVPQVVAHRMTRMAVAGSIPSRRDQKEFRRMSEEKTEAFSQSWTAMATHAFRANQTLAASIFRSFWFPLSKRVPSSGDVSARLQNIALDVLGKGLSPVHRKAVANAKRLARTRLR